MRCPQCGSKMEEDIRDIDLDYQDYHVVCEKMKGNFCTWCDEAILDSESYQIVIQAQSDIIKKSKDRN
jgi:YgiT-type zinc finger domain-containing protein